MPTLTGALILAGTFFLAIAVGGFVFILSSDRVKRCRRQRLGLTSSTTTTTTTRDKPLPPPPGAFLHAPGEAIALDEMKPLPGVPAEQEEEEEGQEEAEASGEAAKKGRAGKGWVRKVNPWVSKK